jgi:polysaccharide biosynthesis/export protein
MGWALQHACRARAPMVVARSFWLAGLICLWIAATFTVARAATGDVIAPGDVISITVFQVKDLSLDRIQVDSDGHVLMPLIGPVEAKGKTATELSTEIASRLGQSWLQSPQVTVVINTAAGEKVSVDGAVNQAGVFELTGRTGLAEVVARAHGPSRVANLHRVSIIRSVDGTPHVASFDLAAIWSGRARDPVVEGADTVVVDTSGIKSLWRGIIETLPSFIVFTYL